jgi:hypothetical protein
MNALAKFSRMTSVEVYTQWEPEGYSKDNSDVWQDSVLVCKKPQASLWSSIKNHLVNRIQFHALAIDLNRIIADTARLPGGDEQLDLQTMASFEKARELRNKLQLNDLPSRADYEDLLKAYEDTKAAYEHTKQAYEVNRQAKVPTWSSKIFNRNRLNDLPSQKDYEILQKAYEDTKAAYEQTRQAYEDTRQAYEDTKRAYEDLKQSLQEPGDRQ